MVMLGQRYTTPIVTVVCPVTKLHHKASLQSASSCKAGDRETPGNAERTAPGVYRP